MAGGVCLVMSEQSGNTEKRGSPSVAILPEAGSSGNDGTFVLWKSLRDSHISLAAVESGRWLVTSMRQILRSVRSSATTSNRQTMQSLCRLMFLVVLLLFSFSHPLFAQTGTATLSGIVTDEGGSIVPNCEIQLQSVDKGTTTVVKTNKDGIYVFSAVQPGPYNLTIKRSGFKQVDFLNLLLNTQDHVQQNFRLQVGSVSESVTVNADQDHMPTDSAAVGLLVDRTFVENMPLNGRSFQDLISLAPGVITSTSGSGEGLGLFSINGQRGDANYFTVDGVSANTNSAGSSNNGENPARGLAGVFPAQTALGTTQSLVSVDALQEFKIQTSTYSVEFGRQPGGQIALTSRSGSNDLHGSLFDYFRNEAFDANCWECDYFAIPKQAERQNHFGGTVGGPLRIPSVYDGKNKTFYFVSYEGLRLRLPAFYELTVPTVALRQFAAPGYQPFLNAFPVPNGPDNADPCVASLNPSLTFPCSAQWTGGGSVPESLNSLSVRVDQVVNERLQLFVRYARTPSTNGFNSGPGLNQELTQNDQSLTVGSTWRISQTLNDELRFNWTDSKGHNLYFPAAIDGGVPYPLSLVVPPQYDPSGAAVAGGVGIYLNGNVPESFSPPGYGESLTTVRQYNLIDNIAWTRGDHSLKFGVDFRRLNSLYDGGQYQSTFEALSASSLEQGVADQVYIQAGQPGRPTFTTFSLFALDNWKWTARLTINYGIRWELDPAPGASDGKYPLALTTGDLSTAQLAPVGTPQYHTRYRNFAPRIGLAYQLNSSQGHPMVVRGGFGIFYDTGQSLGAVGYQGYPFYANNFNNPLTNLLLPATASELAPPSLDIPLVPPYGGIQLNNPNLRLPYMEQWSLSLSEGLSARNTLTASYVGSTGKKLLYSEYYSDLSAINPAFTSVLLAQNAAFSNYDALQVQDQGSIAPGMQIIASYTWAHAIDDASADYGFPPRRGNSDNDIRQIFNMALNYEIPSAATRRFTAFVSRGWSLDQRFVAQSGYPVQVVQNYYLINPGGIEAQIIPDLVAGVSPVLRNAPGIPFGWELNPAAFSPVPVNPDGSPVRQGTLPRNFIHGPGFWNLNTAAQKQFPLTERLRLLFRVEAFNILNHPNAGSPNNCLCSGSSFGTTSYANTIGTPNMLYATGSSRSLQLSLKLAF
jgi:hypothetical protein